MAYDLGVTVSPGIPAAGAPGSAPEPRRPRWPHIVRWLLYGSLIFLGCVLAGAVLVVSRHAAPMGPTFGWPFRLTGRTNVLIMGLDRTVSDQNPNIVYPISRTDTLVAVSVDPGSRHIYLLSVPRDTQALIPGHGIDKINAAHAYGGGTLSLRTVQDFLGVPFPYYIEITERGLTRLIDAVGGVTIRIDKDLNYDDTWDGLHIHLKKGNRRLGGKAAMEYVRFRHDALGDIGRIRRQQQLLYALMDELRSPRVIFRMARILKVFREDVTTNLEPNQLIALAWFGARLSKGGLVRETLPGRFGDDEGYEGYWLPDLEKDRAAVARMFYGIDPKLLAATTVEVLNGTASWDAVTDPLARLQALGLRVLRVGAAPDAAETTVIVHRADPRVAQIVAAAVGAQQVIKGNPGGARGPNLTLVLAKGYAAAVPNVPQPRGTQEHSAAPSPRTAPHPGGGTAPTRAPASSTH